MPTATRPVDTHRRVTALGVTPAPTPDLNPADAQVRGDIVVGSARRRPQNNCRSARFPHAGRIRPFDALEALCFGGTQFNDGRDAHR